MKAALRVRPMPLGAMPVGVVLVGLASCVPPIDPCGWDTVLEQHDRYEVTLDTAYTEASWPAYDPTLAIYGRRDGVEPPPTCGALDEVEVGLPVALRLTAGPSSSRCGLWGAALESPTVELASTPWTGIESPRPSQIEVDGSRDFGDGCHGLWAFYVHLATGDDPYAVQDPEGPPIVLTYRVFQADGDAVDACATRTGLTASGGALTCGDAFVSTMRAVE